MTSAEMKMGSCEACTQHPIPKQDFAGTLKYPPQEAYLSHLPFSCFLYIGIPSEVRSQGLFLVLMIWVLGSGFQEGFCPTDRFQERTHVLARLTWKGTCPIGGTVPSPTLKALGKRSGTVPVLHSICPRDFQYWVGAQQTTEIFTGFLLCADDMLPGSKALDVC